MFKSLLVKIITGLTLIGAAGGVYYAITHTGWNDVERRFKQIIKIEKENEKGLDFSFRSNSWHSYEDYLSERNKYWDGKISEISDKIMNKDYADDLVLNYTNKLLDTSETELKFEKNIVSRIMIEVNMNWIDPSYLPRYKTLIPDLKKAYKGKKEVEEKQQKKRDVPPVIKKVEEEEPPIPPIHTYDWTGFYENYKKILKQKNANLSTTESKFSDNKYTDYNDYFNDDKAYWKEIENQYLNICQSKDSVQANNFIEDIQKTSEFIDRLKKESDTDDLEEIKKMASDDAVSNDYRKVIQQLIQLKLQEIELKPPLILVSIEGWQDEYDARNKHIKTVMEEFKSTEKGYLEYLDFISEEGGWWIDSNEEIGNSRNDPEKVKRIVESAIEVNRFLKKLISELEKDNFIKFRDKIITSDYPQSYSAVVDKLCKVKRNLTGIPLSRWEARYSSRNELFPRVNSKLNCGDFIKQENFLSFETEFWKEKDVEIKNLALDAENRKNAEKIMDICQESEKVLKFLSELLQSLDNGNEFEKFKNKLSDWKIESYEKVKNSIQQIVFWAEVPNLINEIITDIQNKNWNSAQNKKKNLDELTKQQAVTDLQLGKVNYIAACLYRQQRSYGGMIAKADESLKYLEKNFDYFDDALRMSEGITMEIEISLDKGGHPSKSILENLELRIKLFENTERKCLSDLEIDENVIILKKQIPGSYSVSIIDKRSGSDNASELLSSNTIEYELKDSNIGTNVRSSESLILKAKYYFAITSVPSDAEVTIVRGAQKIMKKTNCRYELESLRFDQLQLQIEGYHGWEASIDYKGWYENNINKLEISFIPNDIYTIYRNIYYTYENDPKRKFYTTINDNLFELRKSLSEKNITWGPLSYYEALVLIDYQYDIENAKNKLRELSDVMDALLKGLVYGKIMEYYNNIEDWYKGMENGRLALKCFDKEEALFGESRVDNFYGVNLKGQKEFVYSQFYKCKTNYIINNKNFMAQIEIRDFLTRMKQHRFDNESAREETNRNIAKLEKHLTN